MSETCRSALTFHVPNVMAWVESGVKSIPALTAVAHVVAPYPYQIAKHDSTVWLRTLKALQESGQDEETIYIRTLLLALGLCNAPPAPLDLIAESFEIIHAKAEKLASRKNSRGDQQHSLAALVHGQSIPQRIRLMFASVKVRHFLHSPKANSSLNSVDGRIELMSGLG
jgi:hypothetical protein